MKRKQPKRNPAPFTYKGRTKEISGQDDNKHLLFWCYLDSLRWILWPLLILALEWLLIQLSG